LLKNNKLAQELRSQTSRFLKTKFEDNAVADHNGGDEWLSGAYDSSPLLVPSAAGVLLAVEADEGREGTYCTTALKESPPALSTASVEGPQSFTADVSSPEEETVLSSSEDADAADHQEQSPEAAAEEEDDDSRDDQEEHYRSSRIPKHSPRYGSCPSMTDGDDDNVYW
jgi:hypothetical protein